MLVLGRNWIIPRKEFHFTYSRSSGPGGQNVNKVNTKVSLRWSVVSSPSLSADVRRRFLDRHARRISAGGEIVIVSQRYRDQTRNVADCLGKLKAMLLAAAAPPKRRRPTRPTQSSQERRLRGKHAHAMAKRARSRSGHDD